MILSCPSCHGRYLVPATHFATGPRMVRCARCSYSWMAEMPPEPATALAEQLSALAPPAGESAGATGAPFQSFPVLREVPTPIWQSNWALAGAAVLLVIVLLWLAVDRRDIAHRWPIMETFYDHIGLHVYHPGEGLSLPDVRSEMQFEGGITQLTVEGEVRNDTDKLQSIPDILAAAIGPDGQPIQSWQIDAPAATVAPRESVPFTSSIRAPEGTVIEINLHFIESKDVP